MEEFLNSSIFRYLIFPIASATLGVAIKFATRNDQYSVFKKEDLAVGLDLVLTACLMYVVLTTDRAVLLVKTNQTLVNVLTQNPIDSTTASRLQVEAQSLSSELASAGWFIALMFLGLWSISTFVRKWGWKSETEMTPIIGIALPLAFGVLSLIVVMAGAAR
jgi:hypothetical protein